MKVINVKCEYLDNPLGIDIVSPRITWSLEGCINQVAYEIIYYVNDNKYSSGIITSSSMRYDFKEEFKSRDIVKYIVKVKCDDTWIESSENYFELGLLNESDWSSNWIRGNYKVSKKNRYPVDYFKKEFEVKDVKKARLYISALGVYECYINNKRVGDFVLAPGSTDYRKRVQYQVYDVKDLLVEGKNEIKILLGDGWYRGSVGAKGFTYVLGKYSSVIAQIEMVDSNNLMSTINTDSSFSWSNDGELVFTDLEDGEIVDYNKTPSFNNKAVIIKHNVIKSCSNNYHVLEQESFSPISTFVTNNKRIYEFNQNLAGIVSFKIKGHKGEKVDIVMGEKLDESNEVTLTNVQCIRKGKRTPLQEIHLILKEGINEYHGKFMIAGFKFLQVNSGQELIDLKQIALYNTLEQAYTFECDNELINIFTKNTLWSLKSNSCSVPTDCPTRERMGWTGDSQVFFNSAAYLTNYAPFARKHLVDVFDRQDKNGRLPQIAPYNGEDWYMDVMNGSVGWADVGVLIPYRYYLIYGDDRLLRKYYSDMVRYAHFMIKRCGRAKGVYAIYAKPLHLSKENRKYGINTGQSYGEWAEPKDVKGFAWYDFCSPNPEESMAYTTYILDLMIKIIDILHIDDQENASLFTKYRDGIKKAYQELVTKPRHTLDTDRQAKLVRPLYMNLLTEDQTKYAKSRLIKALENYSYRLGTGFLSTPFILEVLQDIDIDACYKLLENEECPGWLYMSKHSTGTIWEDWEGPTTTQGGIASLNHYSKGALVEWLMSNMLGIKVDGENKFIIKPIIGGKENWAKGSYNSIYGKVSCSWKKEDNKIKVEINVPSNTEARFIYKDKDLILKPGLHTLEV